MNLALIKTTIQIMIIITMAFSLFMEPVIIDWFRYYLITFPIGYMIFSLLGVLLIFTFF